jgi:hypothetical protein
MPSPQLLALSPGVHAAKIETDMVFLDIPSDTYACLPDVAGAVWLDDELDALHVRDTQIATELLSAGVATKVLGSSSEIPLRFQIALPRQSAVGSTAMDLAPRHAPAMAASLVDLLLRYRGRAFADLVLLARGRNPGAGRWETTPEILDLVANFEGWIPYAPVSGKCLLRSFMLLRLLQRHGLDARWVFGVTTWPFQAHCWLQCGDVALDDSVDRLTEYTPILVL